MAQPLQNITITAPAFKGLNTQDSPLSGDAQYASIVDNMVMDTFGRIGSRKGLQALTGSNTPLNGSTPVVIHEYEDAAGAEVSRDRLARSRHTAGTQGARRARSQDVLGLHWTADRFRPDEGPWRHTEGHQGSGRARNDSLALRH